MVVPLLVLLLMSFTSLATDYKWRKAMNAGIESSSSSSSFMSMNMNMNMMNNRVGSSVLFPVHGNVYPTGYYNITINVGQPSRPYFLDLDTGSDLTWLQCDAPCVQCVEAPHPLYRPTNDLVPCKDPICDSLHPTPDHRCDDNPKQCDYEVEYADGGSSLGVLVRDIFALNYTNGGRLSPRLALGCGYDQLPGAGTSHHPLDGILGLGRGKSSIVSQLNTQGLVKNVVGHCLSGRGGGFLFFGDDLYDSSRIVWTSMSTQYSKFYSPGYGELNFGGKSTGLRNLVLVFDSGSSYTYLNSQAYQISLQLINMELSGKTLKEAADDETLPVCWSGRKPFKSLRDVNKYFKSISFAFPGNGKSKSKSSLYELTPESYLIISNKGNVCLGILNGTEVGLKNLNVIGDISMQDKIVIYDNEKERIGWASANCDRLPIPNSKSYYM